MISEKPEIKTVPLAELIEDMDLYPRHAVDSAHVQQLVQALEFGATLPPVRADKKSKRLTDGWHRKRAYQRFLGTEASIDVELIPYKNEAEMLFDAVQQNAAHGRHLDRMDRTRSVMMLQSHGFTHEKIAFAIQVPEKQVQKYAIKIATVPKSSVDAIPGTQSISLKRPVLHMAGKTLTKAQAEAHRILPGTSFLLIAKQLCAGLSQNMVNLEDHKLVDQLMVLRDLLIEKVSHDRITSM
jgi:ParB-like chromosome segregation protein Spo0J